MNNCIMDINNYGISRLAIACANISKHSLLILQSNFDIIEYKVSVLVRGLLEPILNKQIPGISIQPINGNTKVTARIECIDVIEDLLSNIDVSSIDKFLECNSIAKEAIDICNEFYLIGYDAKWTVTPHDACAIIDVYNLHSNSIYSAIAAIGNLHVDYSSYTTIHCHNKHDTQQLKKIVRILQPIND